jgi:predicted component of type VI protein secretion system
VPAENANVDYDIKYDGNEIQVENNGNTFFYMQIDNCRPDSISKQCKQTNTILAGRKKTIKLAEGLKNVDSLSVKVATHDYSYNKTITIHKK